MPGLDPGIHAHDASNCRVDCRVKPGNDDLQESTSPRIAMNRRRERSEAIQEPAAGIVDCFVALRAPRNDAVASTPPQSALVDRPRLRSPPRERRAGSPL